MFCMHMYSFVGLIRRTRCLIPLFSSSEHTGCGYPGLSDMCSQWESNPQLPAWKANTLSARPAAPFQGDKRRVHYRNPKSPKQRSHNLHLLNLKKKIQRIEGKQCRSRWGGSSWATSSGSTLFTNSAKQIYCDYSDTSNINILQLDDEGMTCDFTSVSTVF